MTAGSVTVTGLKELSEAIDTLPETVTAALKGVARDTAYRIQTRAKALAPVGHDPRLGHTKGEPHLKDSIEVIEQAELKQYIVDPNTPWLPNLPLWIERGTRYKRARPFMRPAGDAEDARYKSDSMKAAESVADNLEKF